MASRTNHRVSLPARLGLRTGQTASVVITVTDDMTARFDEKEVHPFYSTFWLAYHAEHAARKLLEPYLTEEIEGIGYKLSLTHISPAFAGDELTITAQLTALRGNKIYAKIEARSVRGAVAIGTQVQAVLSKVRLASLHENR
ncbi:MAG: thioesterase [Rhizobacter sp.]|nr:thioesterase [Chlorobiales bacterium]